MTTADHVDRASSIPASRKILCLVYGVIAVAALIATWSQMLAYFDRAGHLADFWNDQRVTPASRTLTADAVLVALTAVILMVVEARRHAVKFVWLYVALGFATAISVAFPLFLIARELRMGASDEPHPSPTDTLLLAIVAIATAAWTIWVDL
jgi:Terpene cyclase DEP1